jgi:hypothetical protein
MTKMDMIWIAAASLLYPECGSSNTVTRRQIEAQADKLFGVVLTPVMIDRHLVSLEDRMADVKNPRRGGSRNRYLFKTADGTTPSREGNFRLYKIMDAAHDGQDKTGPTHPAPRSIPTNFLVLIVWYKDHYFRSEI